MSYEPFARGPHPVGVRTLSTRDAPRSRELLLELWYPASTTHAGRDLDPATQDRFAMLPGLPSLPQAAVRDAEIASGALPLVAFSHGYASQRRQSTALVTHLASHGYVVVAPDHAGGTLLDVLTSGAGPGSGNQGLAVQLLLANAELRPLAVRAAVDGALSTLGASIDATRIAVIGHSFGGWTALSAPAIDERLSAVVALAPSGGRTPTWPGENPLSARLRLDWGRALPTLVIAAERDTILPLDGLRELVQRLAEPCRFLVLERADHLHFIDHVEDMHELFRTMPLPALYEGRLPAIPPITELVSGERATTGVQGLVLSHLDFSLRGLEGAQPVLAEARARCAEFGLAVREERHPGAEP